MIEYLSGIVGYLSSQQNVIAVDLGFRPICADAPLIEPSAYVSAEKMEDGRLDFCVSVYYPVSSGGSSCFVTAQRLAGILLSEECTLPVRSLYTTGTEYMREFKAFKAQIHGSLICENEKRYYFRAENFSESPNMIVSAGISYYSIERSFENKPIMTIFRELPFGVADGKNIYSIVLPGVPPSIAENMANNGTFDLTVGNETFNCCYCLKCEEKEPSDGSVTVRGYKEREITV